MLLGKVTLSYTIKVLPNEPIVIVDISNFDTNEDLQPYLAEIGEIFDNLVEPTHLITDARHIKINFSGLLAGLEKFVHGDNLFNHPNAGRMILVTEEKLLTMGAKAFGTNEDGEFLIEIYETLDEALSMLRAE